MALYDEIFANCPMLRQIIADKIEAEINSKQAEIDQLKQQNVELQEQLDTLALQILDLMGV